MVFILIEWENLVSPFRCTHFACNTPPVIVCDIVVCVHHLILDACMHTMPQSASFPLAILSRSCMQMDINLAPSAGNSVRRCVSVGSRIFVGSPHHTAVNPATVQDCRIDSWTGPAAIFYNLRGPLTLLDNAFTNGSGTVSMPTVREVSSH